MNCRCSFIKSLFALVACCSISLIATQQSAYAADVTLSTTKTFASLDGSASDADGSSNGVFTVNGNLTLASGGIITCLDSVPANAKSNACPVKLNVSGNYLMQGGSRIYTENRRSLGNGGKITITVGGTFTTEANSVISSSKTTKGASGLGGNIVISATGNVNVMNGSVIAAANRTHRAGDITILSQGKVVIDGIVSSGPNADLTAKAEQMSEYVLDNNCANHQQGGKILIKSGSCEDPALLVGEHGYIVSQGNYLSSDTVTLEACQMEINGMVASVAKKSIGTTPNAPSVVLRADFGIKVNGQDLNSAGPRQGRIRADYIVGDVYIPNTIEISANGEIDIFGPASGAYFAVSANGGNTKNQKSGLIAINSNENKFVGSGRIFDASATASGSSGGMINARTKMGINVISAYARAMGSVNNVGTPKGGTINLFTCSGSIQADASSYLDVTGGSVANGTITMTAAGSVAFPPGKTLPASIVPNISANAVVQCIAFATGLPSCAVQCAVCQGVVDQCGVCNGTGPDQCGICGGDGTSCLDCAGVPNGNSTPDVCGVCGGNGPDQCGICGGNNSTCTDCAGTINGTKVVDACGICDGNGVNSCGTCNGIDEICGICPAFDQCGVCMGDGTSCLDCAGTPYGAAAKDSCGVCGGPGPDSCGVCGGNGPDACGVCGGDGSSCVSCEDKDNSGLIVILDNNAYQQKRLVDGIARELLAASKKSNKKTKAKIKKTVASFRAKSTTLYVHAWMLAYTMPTVVKTCDNVQICAEVDLSKITADYMSTSADLKKLADKAVAELKKFKAYKSGKGKKLADKFKKSASRYHSANGQHAKAAPVNTQVCNFTPAN